MMMKLLILSASLLLTVPAAYAVDWASMASQAMANPAMQQAAGQAAANPAVQQAVLQQALSGATAQAGTGKGALLNAAMAAFTPTQTAQLNTKAQSIASTLFTAKEQNALEAFQNTPEGKSIMAKMPTLVQQLTPVLLQMYAARGTATK